MRRLAIAVVGLALALACGPRSIARAQETVGGSVEAAPVVTSDATTLGAASTDAGPAVAAPIDAEVLRLEALDAEANVDETTSTTDPAVEPVPTEVPTAPAIVDGRLVDVDDGIEDLFAAWVSERIFSGPIFSGGASAGEMLLLQTDVGVRFGIGRDARVHADWGFAFSSSQVRGSFMDTSSSSVPFDLPVDHLDARNPVLGFEWGPRIGETRFSFGLGVAAPTAAGEQIPADAATAASGLASSIAHELMLAMNGGLAPWRYRAERFGLFLPVSFQFPIDQMTIAIEGAAAIAAPVIGAGRNRPVTGDLTADLQLSGDVIPELRLGARFGIAVLGIGENLAPGTIVQPSVAASARMRLDPVFLVGEVLVDLGGYYGLSGNGGVWSVTLGGGAAIP